MSNQSPGRADDASRRGQPKALQLPRLVNVFSFGFGGEGRLGLGDVISSCQRHPHPIFSLGNSITNSVLSAAAGTRHTLLLLKSGHVFSCGALDDGRLGQTERPAVLGPDGSACDLPPSLRPKGNVCYPAPVRLLTPKMKIKSVACGSESSYAVTETGEAYAWGSGRYGCLGLGDLNDRWEPTRINIFINGRIQPVRQLSAGRWFCVALCDGPRTYVWGANSSGQCGIGKASAEPVLSPRELKWASNQTPGQVAAGAEHAICLVTLQRTGGKPAVVVFGWGSHADGRLGEGRATNFAVPMEISTVTLMLKKMKRAPTLLAAGGAHSVLVLDFAREVLAWGQGLYGQLGDGNNRDRSVPVLVRNITSVTAISCGERHSAAITEGGHLWAWGFNNYGEAGIGTTDCLLVPHHVASLQMAKGQVLGVATGDRHTIAITLGKAQQVRQDDLYSPYFDALEEEDGLLMFGQLRTAMKANGLDPDLLERPYDVLPGQPGSEDADVILPQDDTIEWCHATGPSEGMSESNDTMLKIKPLGGAKAATARKSNGVCKTRCLPCKVDNICSACARQCHGRHATEITFNSGAHRTGSNTSSTIIPLTTKSGETDAAGLPKSVVKPIECACSANPFGICQCKWSRTRSVFTTMASKSDRCIDVEDLKALLVALRGSPTMVSHGHVDDCLAEISKKTPGGLAELRRISFNAFERWYESYYAREGTETDMV